MSHGCPKDGVKGGVSMFQVCFKHVSWVFHGRLKVIRCCFKGFSRMFQGCIQDDVSQPQ